MGAFAAGGRLAAKLQESVADWNEYFEQLASERRAGRASVGGATYWVAAERVKAFEQVFPEAQFETRLPEVDAAEKSREDVLLDVATGWMLHTGPVTVAELGSTLGLPTAAAEKAPATELMPPPNPTVEATALRGMVSDTSVNRLAENP